jgi:hypothetical protein
MDMSFSNHPKLDWRTILGSARGSRAGFGVSPKQSFGKVRDGGDALAGTRAACAPQNIRGHTP